MAGAVRPNAGADAEPVGDNPENLVQLIRLPGQQYDEETGLYYNRHRYYDPETGRYISQDPIGLKGGLNPYAYPLNPITEVDPLGLIVWMVIPGVCAAGGCEAILVGLGLSASIAGQQIQANSANFSGQSSSSSWDGGRQSEYEHAKMFCDTPPPPGSNECSSLSKKIDHSKECINLYENWDSRWLPGRHDEKLDGWRQRLNNLKEEHNKKCTK
nr:RHS repeat-associated core domain-containing protein [Salmonella bongori]